MANGGSRAQRAETLERNLSKNALATYVAVLADLGQEQIVRIKGRVGIP